MRGFTLAMALAMAAAAACGGKDEDDWRGDAVPEAGKTLTLTDAAIVAGEQAQAEGPWTFGALMRGLRPGSSVHEASELIKKWLVDWAKSRPEVREQILCPWLDASNDQKDCRNGELDLARAPFKLIAIANRMDLHDPEHCEDAGELRFAFALIGEDGKEKPLTVIFEYVVPTDLLAVPAWAARWRELENFSCTKDDCDDYRAMLEGLTAMVTEGRFFAAGDVIREEDEGGEEDEDEFEEDCDDCGFVTNTNLRHLRIHDRTFAALEFREYDLKDKLVESPAEETQKCQSCHTDGGGEAGVRFNILPGAEGDGRMDAAIRAMMPARAERLNDLMDSTCEPTDRGGGRSVPW